MNLRSILGIDHPILQAPLAGVQGSAMAIAVSNAGGLGALPCAMLSHAQLAAELEAIRRGTDRPYNLNFFCHTPPAPDPAVAQDWRARLRPYCVELGLDPDAPPSGGGRAPFDHAIADLVEPYRPPVVSFHFGLPQPDLLERVKGWGSYVLSSATTVDEARWLVAHGVDAVIAQGLEAGGHRGMFLSDDLTTQVGTMALLPQIVRAVDVPVIATGGIATPEGVSAAFRLGASAVQAGTAYLLADEATTSPLHRDAIRSPAARHTALTNVFTGRPARGIMNRLMRELGPMNAQAPAFPLASVHVAALRSAAEARGDAAFSPLWCGQDASACQARPAAEITAWLASGA